MQTMMVEVNTDNALKVLRSLNKKKQIRIVDEISFESPSLPGKPMPLSAFKSWIEDAESADTISLKEAKKLWAVKRKQLQKTSK
jgi:hypothetical protein